MIKINDNTLSFLDENNNEVMYMGFLSDEFIWGFNTDEVIAVDENSVLYEPLKNMMKQDYYFDEHVELTSYKDSNKLVWYSDCMYNPDDEFSLLSVSCMHIEYIDNCFKIWCVRPLDKLISRRSKNFAIVFSPSNNGVFTRNKLTGATFQDDIVINIYRELLKDTKVRRLFK